ncbi:MAG: TIGR01777 family oxidoreductase [Candidatus Pristimantibacillus lignocellulolyticus]|uniref:TIGR01777 family oxidoreductase n=1 Tax=Candidatus Pristimantibacillus lignocellulolyticus TaxID=2994561 RepID=A0A9J6ZJ08_9BACL|nr:MAG: TIGR01777 family oxidoreductase [Candidatus Pristimantibacillus lignocellulolyticus]
MKIAIAGGNGFVGKALRTHLLDQQHEVFILSRNTQPYTPLEGVTYVNWLNKGDQPELQLEGIDAIINLAGESLNSGRWSAARKRRILDSRLTATKEIKRIIAVLQHKPSVLLNASAVGYYGTSRAETFTEQHRMQPTDFLSSTVEQWEQEAMNSGIRTVFLRFGVILGKHEGALPRMVLPYKLFGGGTIGSGQQMLSWVHIEDVVRAALYCITTPSLTGPVNITAPNPVNMKAFGKMIGHVLHRPHWMPVPAFMLKLLLGEMSVLILEGQKVLPNALLEHGFIFSYPTLESGLQDLLK